MNSTTDSDAGIAPRWQRFLADLRSFSADPVALDVQGQLVRVKGLVLEASGLRLPVGSVCEIEPQAGAGSHDKAPVMAEVVGFSFLMELSFLGGRAKLDGYELFSVLTY